MRAPGAQRFNLRRLAAVKLAAVTVRMVDARTSCRRVLLAKGNPWLL
jgi:hypothetical protein